MRMPDFRWGSLLVAACGAACTAGDGYGAAAQTANAWYVNADSGDDQQSGRSPEDAKRTLASAVGASQPGDTIFIAPGTYAGVDPKDGQHWIGSGWETIIEKDQFLVGAIQLNSVSGVTIENLRARNLRAGGQGVSALNCDACVLRRVWADGPLDGMRLDGFHHGSIDQCKATSDYDALVVNGRGIIVQNTTAITTGLRGGTDQACFKTSLTPTSADTHVTFVNCQAYCSRTEAVATGVAGFQVDGQGVMLLENCSALIVSTADDDATPMFGIRAKQQGVCVVSGNGVFRARNSGCGDAFDLKQEDEGVLQVDPTTVRYDSSCGTITVRLPKDSPETPGGVATAPADP